MSSQSHRNSPQQSGGMAVGSRLVSNGSIAQKAEIAQSGIMVPARIAGGSTTHIASEPLRSSLYLGGDATSAGKMIRPSSPAGDRSVATPVEKSGIRSGMSGANSTGGRGGQTPSAAPSMGDSVVSASTLDGTGTSFGSVHNNAIGTSGGTMKAMRGTKTGKKGSGTHFSRSYPRGVGVDFRKLSNWTLMSFIDHHGVSVRSGAPPSELAVGVARHFEAMDVDEERVVGGFLSRLSGSGNEYVRETSQYDGLAPPLTTRKRRRSRKAARPGEQVAAKVTRTDENGSWILASVQRFYADTETYDVQDEDDPSKLIRLPWNHVMRLSTGSEGCFTKGAHVMAIFPETTSFYRAMVSKQPAWKRGTGSSTNTSGNVNGSPVTPIVRELIVKFEDDEVENGHTPHRRVPSRYVIPIPSMYFFEDEDDIDLSPPGAEQAL